MSYDITPKEAVKMVTVLYQKVKMLSDFLEKYKAYVEVVYPNVTIDVGFWDEIGCDELSTEIKLTTNEIEYTACIDVDDSFNITFGFPSLTLYDTKHRKIYNYDVDCGEGYHISWLHDMAEKMNNGDTEGVVNNITDEEYTNFMEEQYTHLIKYINEAYKEGYNPFWNYYGCDSISANFILSYWGY